MNQNEILRAKNPLVHCITNYVTVNDVANSILAVGGSPIMADDESEVAEVSSIANSLVINIGTLNSRTIKSMEIAGRVANSRNIPVILDPVGAGVSKLRNQTVENLLRNIKFAAIRGNLSEIGFCAGKNSSARGVDTNEEKNLESREVASIVAEKFNCIAIITGAEDVVTDGKNFAFIQNGVSEMRKITGTGCMLSGILGAYIGASENHFDSSVSAVASMGIAGEIASENCRGTGSLHIGISDALSRINDDTISKRGKIRYEKN